MKAIQLGKLSEKEVGGRGYKLPVIPRGISKRKNNV